MDTLAPAHILGCAVCVQSGHTLVCADCHDPAFLAFIVELIPETHPDPAGALRAFYRDWHREGHPQRWTQQA